MMQKNWSHMGLNSGTQNYYVPVRHRTKTTNKNFRQTSFSSPIYTPYIYRTYTIRYDTIR